MELFHDGESSSAEGRDKAEAAAIYREIVAARVKLLFDKPFFGNLATRLNAIEVTWCNTAATDAGFSALSTQPPPVATGSCVCGLVGGGVCGGEVTIKRSSPAVVVTMLMMKYVKRFSH